MSYNIGDKVVYPMHGAGIIESIEEKKILSEKQKYYIMRMPIGDMRVMVPTDNILEIGIRDVIEKNEALAVIEAFKEYGDDNNANWSGRYRENMLKIKTGDVLEVAYVVKTLMLRDKRKGLSTGERKMLNTSKQILISELALAQIDSPENIDELLASIVQDEISNCKEADSVAEHTAADTGEQTEAETLVAADK